MSDRKIHDKDEAIELEEKIPFCPPAFVIIEGGIVQNNTSAYVFDLDVLDSDLDSNDPALAEELYDLYERVSCFIAKYPFTKKDLNWVKEDTLEAIKATENKEIINKMEDLNKTLGK